MEDVTHPAYPYMNARASLLFIVEEWAVVHVDISSYQERAMRTMGAYPVSLQENMGVSSTPAVGHSLRYWVYLTEAMIMITPLPIRT